MPNPYSTKRRSGKRRRGLVGVLGSYAITIQVAARPPQHPSESPPPLPACAILVAAGLDGWSLAAVSDGVESSQELVSSASATIGHLRQAIERGAAGRRATTEQAAAERACGAGGATPERLEEMVARLARVESLQQEHAALRASALASLQQLFVARFGAENGALANRIASNMHRRVPAAFRALSLSEETWRTLESACWKVSRDHELLPAESAALTAAQGDPVVQTISARIEASAPAIEAWVRQEIEAAVAAALPQP